MDQNCSKHIVSDGQLEKKKNKGRNGTSHGHPVSHVQPISANSSHLELLQAIFVELLGAIESYLELSRAIYSHLEPFCAIWSHLAIFGAN